MEVLSVGVLYRTQPAQDPNTFTRTG
jgi:hypothetical protein